MSETLPEVALDDSIDLVIETTVIATVTEVWHVRASPQDAQRLLYDHSEAIDFLNSDGGEVVDVTNSSVDNETDRTVKSVTKP
jgi:hypothetical protein